MRTNRNTPKILLVTSLVMILALGVGDAMAQGRGGQRGMGRGGPALHRDCDGSGAEIRLERLAERLDLTEDQIEAIGTIQEGNRERNVPLRKEMMQLRNELKGELLKDDPAQKTLLELNAKIGELRTEMQANRLQTRLAVRQELTPGQRDQMMLMGGKGHRGSGRGSKAGRGGRGFGPGPFADPDCPRSSDRNER